MGSAISILTPDGFIAKYLLPLRFRIVVIVVLPTAMFFIGLLYLDQYRETVLVSELAALSRQGNTLAKSIGLADAEYSELAERRISSETMQRATQLIASIPDARIRLFQPDGSLIIDSIASFGLAAPKSTLRTTSSNEDGIKNRLNAWLEDAVHTIATLLSRSDSYPVYREKRFQSVSDFPAIAEALGGDEATFIMRDSEDGQLILGVAVPIRHLRVVRGALMVTASGERAERDIIAVQYSFFQIFLGILVITIILGGFLSRSIIRPIRKLAVAADTVRQSSGARLDLPDLTARQDEIGTLARDITAMTKELQRRASATADFAADVAHEIKNPLTSLRSAVETLDRLKDKERQQKLIKIIVSDVKRLDRLISDISAASKLDRDLLDAEYETVNIIDLITSFAEARNVSLDHAVLELDLPDKPLWVRVAVDRIIQILDNLLTNAVSFSPPRGAITITIKQIRDMAVIDIADQGCGIAQGKTEAIFDRFYSERPKSEKFGEHSGLGLSISRRIAEVHGGTLTAANQGDDKNHTRITGAMLTLTLPLWHGDAHSSVS